MRVLVAAHRMAFGHFGRTSASVGMFYKGWREEEQIACGRPIEVVIVEQSAAQRQW
jgi:hypothetical protein